MLLNILYSHIPEMINHRTAINGICHKVTLNSFLPLSLVHTKCIKHGFGQVTTYFQKKEIFTSPITYTQQYSKENLYKDIYKDIGYKSPFTTDQNLLILRTINAKQSQEKLGDFTAKTKAVLLFEHIQTHGEFKLVEELLSVKKFDEKVIERLGKKIIKLHDKYEESFDEPSESLNIENTRFNKAKNNLMKYMKPKLKANDYLSKSIKSIVAIKLSYYQFSYAHMDKATTTILDWYSSECFEQKESSQHPKIYETALRIVRDIPAADLYIIEEQPFLKTKLDSNIDFEGV
jgi:hypothetical protein